MEVYSTRELVELEVATMAKTLDRSTQSLTKERTDPLARTGSSSFYRCLGPLPPKLGGKGYHIATKEEAGYTIKVESMDAVHGRSGVTKAEKATVQPGRWADAAEVGRVPR